MRHIHRWGMSFKMPTSDLCDKMLLSYRDEFCARVVSRDMHCTKPHNAFQAVVARNVQNKVGYHRCDFDVII